MTVIDLEPADDETRLELGDDDGVIGQVVTTVDNLKTFFLDGP